MAKHHQKISGKAVATRDGQEASQIDHEQIYDDTLLPDAAELARLKELDPNIVEWLKTRTEKEQDMRHEFTRSRMNLADKNYLRAFITDLVVVITALLVLVASMAATMYLLYNEKTVEGTIFGGMTTIFAVRAILNFKKPEAKNSNPNEKK